MTKAKVRPEIRGLVEPTLAERSDEPLVLMGIKCLACGGDLLPMFEAPGTPHIVTKVVLACSTRGCAGAWMATLSLRALKPHEVERLASEARAQLALRV
jgi:hypothetical protein